MGRGLEQVAVPLEIGVPLDSASRIPQNMLLECLHNVPITCLQNMPLEIGVNGKHGKGDCSKLVCLLAREHHWVVDGKRSLRKGSQNINLEG